MQISVGCAELMSAEFAEQIMIPLGIYGFRSYVRHGLLCRVGRGGWGVWVRVIYRSSPPCSGALCVGVRSAARSAACLSRVSIIFWLPSAASISRAVSSLMDAVNSAMATFSSALNLVISALVSGWSWGGFGVGGRWVWEEIGVGLVGWEWVGSDVRLRWE